METREMKTRYVMVMAVLFILSGMARATVSVLWQADLDSTGHGISRVKLTPDGGNLIVFHYTGDHTWGSEIPARFDKLDTQTGDNIWAPYREITKSGEKISANGWVDNSGNLYIMPTWSGYTLWKYNSELDTELWSYTGSTGFEYIRDVITDEFDNVYIAGNVGSSSYQPSALVKLTSSGSFVWSCASRHYTSRAKEDYTRGMALDSQHNLFRVGANYTFYEPVMGRLIGHRDSDGAEIVNYVAPDENSAIQGITIDNDDYIYIGYTYNIFEEYFGSVASEEERTVIQKLVRNGDTADVVWEYRFDEVGMSLQKNCIIKHTDNSFYVAFNQRQDGTTVPGIAEFGINGNLLWKETLDKAGWNLNSGIDAKGDYIYVGLNKIGDATQSQVVCLGNMYEPSVPDIDVSPLSHDFGNVELGTSTTLVATISNVGTGDLTVSGIALETDFAITSVPSAAIVVGPGETKDVEITYTPSSLGYNSAVLKIRSDDPDEPVVEVMLSVVGITTPPPPSEQIANILSFFDTSVADTTLEGDGQGKSADKRLNALRNMIKAAGDLIQEELYAEACQQLIDVSTRMDGQHNPPDFVKGESVEELGTMVQYLTTSLGG